MRLVLQWVVARRNALLAGLLGWALALRVAAGSITVKGSDTMILLGQKWAEVYMRKNPGTTIQVTGGGSGTGFAALQNKQTDLAQASRRIRAKEVERCIKAFGKRPREYAVALDALCIYVNEKNPIESLSLENIRNIFTGRFKNWKEVGGADAAIILYSRENNSGTYEFFKDNILLGRDFDASAQTLAGTAQVLQQVAQDVHGIGYGSTVYGVGAKHLRVALAADEAAVEPSEASVVAQKYPIWRYLYVYLNPDLDRGDLKAYLDWMRGDDAQKLVGDLGYYPLPAHLRAP